jgi:hypothetical protein
VSQQVAIWALGGALTVALFVIGRVFTKMDALRTENQALRDANIDLKLAVVELKGTARAVDRTLGALPVATPSEGGTP